MKVLIAILMGVSGSGKTTVGRLLAADLGWQFYDADDFHSPENIRKMSSGQPLTDADRSAWLDSIADLIASNLEKREPAVIACSALKASYRDRLDLSDQVRFVYLKGDPDIIRRRLEKRSDHFMSAALLSSQFETLEEPENALIVDIDAPPEFIVATIKNGLLRTFSDVN